MLENTKSGTQWCVCPKYNALYWRQKVHLFANVLQYYFSALLQQDACFGIFVLRTDFLLFTLSFMLVLWSTMLLIHPQFSPITAIKLCNCFKVTIDLVVKSLSGFLLLWQLSEKGRLYLCSGWVYWYTIQSVINNFTLLKWIFNVCF